MPLALRDLQAAFAVHLAGADRDDLLAVVTGDTIPAAARLAVYRLVDGDIYGGLPYRTGATIKPARILAPVLPSKILGIGRTTIVLKSAITLAP